MKTYEIGDYMTLPCLKGTVEVQIIAFPRNPHEVWKFQLPHPDNRTFFLPCMGITSITQRVQN